ncbi:unnamed protein product, partial [Symbiodinium microadriaticum]
MLFLRGHGLFRCPYGRNTRKAEFNHGTLNGRGFVNGFSSSTQCRQDMGRIESCNRARLFVYRRMNPGSSDGLPLRELVKLLLLMNETEPPPIQPAFLVSLVVEPQMHEKGLMLGNADFGTGSVQALSKELRSIGCDVLLIWQSLGRQTGEADHRVTEGNMYVQEDVVEEAAGVSPSAFQVGLRLSWTRGALACNAGGDVNDLQAGIRMVPQPRVRVAAIQCSSRMGSASAVEDNAEKMERLARKAAEGGAKIIVFPEAALTGYTSQAFLHNWHIPQRRLQPRFTGIDPTGVVPKVDSPRGAQDTPGD